MSEPSDDPLIITVTILGSVFLGITLSIGILGWVLLQLGAI